MELKKYKLGELIDVKRGTSLAGEHYATSGDLIRLTCGNFDYNNNCFKENTSKDDIYYTAPVREEYIMNEGDIITPLTEQAIGLLGSTAIVPESGKYIQSQDVAKIICKEKLIDHDFAFYLISSSVVKKQLSVAAQQTKIRHTSPDKIKDCVVWIPSLQEQKQIASVLSNLDRKIALNRAINRNLEAMAKQLYDYWFVQFDFPNEEGKPYKSSGGKMVWNETLKREIPEGWEVRPLGGVVTKYQQGLIRSNSQLSNEGKFAYLKMGDLDGHGGYTCENLARTNATDKEVSSYTLSFGDFLINVRNSKEIVGKTCLINYVEKDTLYNHMLVRLDFNNVSALYMKHVFNSSYMTKLIDGIKKGTTTVIALYQEDLYRLPVLVPSCAIMNMFDELTYGMQKNIALSNEISYSLKSIRKHILPLLMNGQVSVTQLNSDLSAR